MITPQLQKIIVIFITLMFISYIGYSLYNVTPDVSVLTNDSGSEADSQEILAIVAKLQETKIDSSVFTSDLFVTLKDVSPIITTEEVGRVNPFATIGSDLVLVQSSRAVSSTNKVSSN